MASRSLPNRWLWTPVVVYMAMIFVLSSITDTPSIAQGADKDLHALLYAGLAALVARALAGGWRRRMTAATMLLTIVIATAYGVTDEAHQYFVPARTADVHDVAADAAGAAAAAAALYVWGIIRGRHGV